jgi:hypothetical protein
MGGACGGVLAWGGRTAAVPGGRDQAVHARLAFKLPGDILPAFGRVGKLGSPLL